MERIGEYLVKRLVGEGGMGKVYEAEERLTQRRVALKVLRPELTKDDDGRRLFLNEMQILAHLEHPNVVRSLASIEQDGQLVLVLEFLDGRTLRDELVARGKLPWHEAVEVVVRIAEALGVAHGQEPSIIHRDLKPENVMLTADGGLKVMDFGIAKVLEAVHGTNTQSIGTLQYMSPEQIDATSIDTRSDLYSLGLIFYEALTGTAPFRSASPRELLNLQCTASPPALAEDVRRGLPRGIESVLFDLLEKAPEDRPASAADVVERLAPFRAAEEALPRAARSKRSPRASAVAPKTEREGAPPSSAATSGDTMHSRPSRPEAPSVKKADTIALIERATEPRQLPTSIAVLMILGLSLVAGVATYVIRLHSAAPSEGARATTASADLHNATRPATR